MSTVSASGRAWCATSILYFILFRLTVEEIACILEDADDLLHAKIYKEPPVNAILSDGDSDDDEPSGNINRLSGNELRAGAEFIGSWKMA